MSASTVVIQFISFLALVRSMFRQTHMFAETVTAISDVSTHVEPFKVEGSDYADNGVTLSISLNANLRKPQDPERQAIGMSLLIRRSGGSWIADAEVGFTGRDVGWDPFDSKEAQFDTVEDLMIDAAPLVNWMDRVFRDAVAKLPE